MSAVPAVLPRRGVRRRIVDLLVYGNPDALVFFMGLGAIFWGAFLWLPSALALVCSWLGICPPYELWSTFGSSPTYNFMARIGAEWKWGAVLTGCAFIKLLVLFYADRHVVKIAANGVMFGVWSFVWVSVILGNPASTGLITYFFFALASLWCMIRRTMQLLGAR